MCSLGSLSAEDLLEPKHSSVCSDGKFKIKSDFSSEEWELLSFRTNGVHLETICRNHELIYLSLYKSKQKKICCDPFSEEVGKPEKAYNVVTLALCQSLQSSYPQLKPGRNLCPKCHCKMMTAAKKLELEKINNGSTPLENVDDVPTVSPTDSQTESQSQSSGDTTSSGSVFQPTPKSTKAEGLNDIAKLEEFLLSKRIRLDKKKMDGVAYCKEKYMDICKALKESFEAVCQTEIRSTADDCDEIISQLKDKFESKESSYSTKIGVLSVLPKSWSLATSMSVFGLKSKHIIATTKKLVKEQGILPAVAKRAGHGLSEKVVSAVQKFYDEDDEAVHMLPGKNDCFTVKKGTVKEKVQKRLLLAPLHELYAMFCEKHKDIKISFSAFAMRRPKYCVLAGDTGTSTVCVCTYHQNVQLMIEGVGLKHATKNDEHPIKDTKSLLSLIRCDPPKEACIEKKCDECPGSYKLQEYLELILDIECVDTVVYHQWVKSSESKFWTLATVQKEKEDFAASLVKAAEDLIVHDFIAMKQKEQFSNQKLNLKPGEAIISMDFSENYSFVIQESIQSFHWSNQQATVHPFVAYYKNDAGELCHDSYITVSDHLKHESNTVFVFLKKYLEHLKQKVTGLKHVHYWTDGCAAQYKSFKTVANLCHHALDFELTAEHHYFATSHGKTANDGVGGTFKRAATLASVRGSLIRTPKELYEWALKKWPQDGTQKLTVIFVSEAEVMAATSILETRWKGALPVPNIKQMHYIKPLSIYEISTKKYSESEQFSILTVRHKRVLPDLASIGNGEFVTVFHENTWKLAAVIDKNEELNSLTVEIYKKDAKQGNRWSEKEQAITCNHEDILTRVTPNVKRTWANTFIYTLSPLQSQEAKIQFNICKGQKEETRNLDE